MVTFIAYWVLAGQFPRYPKLIYVLTAGWDLVLMSLIEANAFRILGIV